MDSRVQKMAQVITNFSMKIQPQERVLIRATSPAAEPLVQALYQEALRVGAYAFPYIHLRDEDSLAIEATHTPDVLGAVNPMLEMMYQTCDVIIRIDAEENPVELSHYPTDLQRHAVSRHSELINIQMKRTAEGFLRRCTTSYPVLGHAQRAGMSRLQYEDFFFKACKLHLDDPVSAWQALDKQQQKLVEYLKGKKHLQIQGKHIDMEMSIEGRIFISAGGDENFPDGEIFTGPVEDSVNGWVKFDNPSYYNSNVVYGAYLKFKDGLIVDASADRNEAYLLSVLDVDPGARRLGEFAIGNNYDIQHVTGAILFDEKIGGTIHMAVGQGYAETGSVNTSSVHWDLICGMQEDSEILVDGELFYKNGNFIV